MKIDGRCHCGFIAYEAEVDPDEVFICHCTDCQAISGTVFRRAVPVPEGFFKLLTGNPRLTSRWLKAARRATSCSVRNARHRSIRPPSELGLRSTI